MKNCMPRNAKEGLLYGGIICALTCICMATINISIAMGGISKLSLITTLKAFPMLFIIAMLIETFIVSKIADKLVEIFTSPTDSLNAYILFKTFFTVIGMSIIMTAIGGFFANGLDIIVFREFPLNWPRNFCIVIFLELLLVQPFARNIMRLLHK